jgi:hypothetical protein
MIVQKLPKSIGYIPQKTCFLDKSMKAFLGNLARLRPNGWSVSIVKEPELLIAVYPTPKASSGVKSRNKS